MPGKLTLILQMRYLESLFYLFPPKEVLFTNGLRWFRKRLRLLHHENPSGSWKEKCSLIRPSYRRLQQKKLPTLLLREIQTYLFFQIWMRRISGINLPKGLPEQRLRAPYFRDSQNRIWICRGAALSMTL